MNKKLEDSLGKLAMLLWFGYATYLQIFSMAATIIHRAEISMWQLALVSQIASSVFFLLIVYFTITRLPPRDSAEGLEPRITAIAGTFIMMLLIVLPLGVVGPEIRLLSAILILVGTILSAYCIRQLGRSFSIMATARKLVTEGPYKIVRHPLYGAEVITIFGLVLNHWTVPAAALGIIWIALQIRRAQNEERILRASFPEYNDYARRVPMLLPGFIAPKSSRA